VLLGSYEEPVFFHYRPTLFENEPDILPSRYCTNAEMQEVVSMMQNGRLKPKTIPETTYAVEEAITAYEKLVQEKKMRVMFMW